MPNADNFEWPQGNPLFEVMWRSVTESLAGNGIASSGDLEVTATNNALEVEVSTGTAYYGGSEYTLGSAETHTLTAGDATHDRWDTVYFDTSGPASGVREGTAEANPEPPDIQGDELLLAVVYVPSTATDFTNSNVLNWRGGFSNEAAKVQYADSTGEFSASDVEAALDELQEAAQIQNHPLANSELANSSITVSTNSPVNGGGSVNLGDSTSIGLNDLVDGDIDSSADISRSKISDEWTVTSKDADYTVSDGDEVVAVQTNTAGAGVTVTIPSGEQNDGRILAVVDSQGSASSNPITITSGSGSTTFGGSSSITINSDYGSTLLQYNESDDSWVEVGGGGGSGVSSTWSADVTSGNHDVGEERAIFVQTSTAGQEVFVTIPSAQHTHGRVFLVADAEGSADEYPITITSDDSVYINGEGSLTIDKPYGAAVLIYWNTGTFDGWSVFGRDAEGANLNASDAQKLVTSSTTSTVSDGGEEVMYIGSLGDDREVAAYKASLSTPQSNAVPSGVDLEFSTLSSGSWSNEATILSGDGSTVYADDTGSPITAATNTSGSEIEFAIRIVNTSGSSVDVHAAVSGLKNDYTSQAI